MNWDLSMVGTPGADAVTELARAAHRALRSRVIWTAADAAAAVREQLLPLCNGASPAMVRDVLVDAARLAVDEGIFRAPDPVGSWPVDALLSAELRARDPSPLPGS